jgi:ferredoxin
MRSRAKDLLASGEVTQVLAWEAGQFPIYPKPALFTDITALSRMVYNRFCTINLCKYLIGISKPPAKTLIFLRPCDAYGYTRLAEENQIDTAHIHPIGIGCEGNARIINGEERGLLESCRVCTKTNYPPLIGELLEAEHNPRQTADPNARLTEVNSIEALNETERYTFWQNHLERCIRCNACRNICLTCHCKVCILDEEHPFEKQHFHITRAFHQFGRCTDCGQCSRVCPLQIPLHLLNRKLIKNAPSERENL